MVVFGIYGTVVCAVTALVYNTDVNTLVLCTVVGTLSFAFTCLAATTEA